MGSEMCIRDRAACIALNAANEVAVAAFLDEGLRYADIPRIISESLNWLETQPAASLDSLDDILALDRETRLGAMKLIKASLLR